MTESYAWRIFICMDYVSRPAQKSDASAMYYISIRAHTQGYYDQLIPLKSMPSFVDYYRVSTHKRQSFISSVNRKIDDSRWLLYVAESNKQIIGYATAFIEDHYTLWLRALFVDPRYHQLGIGSFLLETKLGVVAEGMKVRLLVITNNQVAKTMYERYGFKVIGRAAKTFFGAQQDVMERS